MQVLALRFVCKVNADYFRKQLQKRSGILPAAVKAQWLAV
jgi:hypothetical protein